MKKNKNSKLVCDSKLTAVLEGTTLYINQHRSRESSNDEERVDISELAINKDNSSIVKPVRYSQRNKIILVSRLEDPKESLIVYTTDKFIIYRKQQSDNHPLNELIRIRSRTYALHFGKRTLSFWVAVLIEDPYGILDYKSYDQYFYIANGNQVATKIPVVNPTTGLDNKHKKARRIQVGRFIISPKALLKGTKFVKFSSPELFSDENFPINTPIQFCIKLKNDNGTNGEPSFTHQLLMPKKRYNASPKFYYSPVASVGLGDQTAHIRRTRWAGLVLMRRRLEPEEKTWHFRFYESWPVSLFLYYSANVYNLFSTKKVNIYYEKNTSKAEEGTYELFLRAKEVSKSSKQYYIITKDSQDYPRIKKTTGVLVRDTLASYWAIYRASNAIATEAPSHVTILRSNNYYLRKSIYAKSFIFLQHGITYMKCQGPNSAFLVGKEAEPNYMVVDSKNEANVVTDMMGLPEERLIISGQPIFDRAKHEHINKDSIDIATIMLTWKPYEEKVPEFTSTTNYRYNKLVYDELTKYLPPENIRVVAHPKMAQALSNSSFADRLWKGPVSEAIKDTKLLVTDYSSICYFSFYQGAGVIFFQPDLEDYETRNGPLIPRSDEYIGPRTIERSELSNAVSNVIDDGRINLRKLRSPAFVKNYQSINEFSDGKNCERVYERLSRLGIL